MGNKDVRKEAKTRHVSVKSGEQALRAAASTVARGGLEAFENACKAIAAQEGLLNRQGDGKFWRDNTDPALLAARDESDRRWLTMPVAWSQSKKSERMWLLPRMIFCAGKSSMSAVSTLESGREQARSLACSHLIAFAKRSFGDIDWLMSEASWVDWVARGVANGSPASSLAMLEAMKSRMPKDVFQALAAKACAGSLAAGADLGICMSMANLAGGVRCAEDILERMGRATRTEVHPHEPDYALARRIRGFVDEPTRAGSLLHRALDALPSRPGPDGNDAESSREVAKAVKWLCSEGAKTDALSFDGDVEQGALCPLGRALRAASAWSVVDALLESGVDAAGAEGCSILPLSVLCSRSNSTSVFEVARRAGWGEDVTRQSEMRAMESLLAAGALVDAMGGQRETALLRAAGAVRFDFFESLLKAGANADHKDLSGAGWPQWARGEKSGRPSWRQGKAWVEEFMAQAESLVLASSCAGQSEKSPRQAQRL